MLENSYTPVFICKLTQTPCITSCKIFDKNCKYKVVNKNYIPFKSLLILPTIFKINHYNNKYSEIDSLIRAFSFIISSTFGKQNENILKLNEEKEMEAIKQIMLTDLIHNYNIIENKEKVEKIKPLLNIERETDKEDHNLIEILNKITKFIEINIQYFTNQSNVEIINNYVNYLKSCINTKSLPHLNIINENDFTNYITENKSYIIKLNKMLLEFPNDIPNLNTIVTELLKMMEEARIKYKQKITSPKEFLLKSENILHKRIAIDEPLFEFYKKNNKTKKINNVIF